MNNKDKNNLIIGIIAIVAVIILLGLFGSGFGSDSIMSGFGSFALLGWIINLGIIVLIILGIVWLVNHLNYNQGRK